MKLASLIGAVGTLLVFSLLPTGCTGDFFNLLEEVEEAPLARGAGAGQAGAHADTNTAEEPRLTLIPEAPSGISGWAVVIEAYSWLGVPYQWGGEDRSGVDCSGLVRQVYMRASGESAHYVDRTVAGIKDHSDPIYPPAAGDLVLFRNKRTGRWTHVGIYLWNGYFIHASYWAGKVVRDHLYYSPYYGTGWWGRHYYIQFARYNPDYWIS